MLNRILSFYTRCFALWVILGGLAAYCWPGPLASLDRRSVNAVFALTMFGIGAVLQAEDFRRILQRPVIVLIGTVTQYSLMPLVAYAIANVFQLDPQIAVGLILTAAAPGRHVQQRRQLHRQGRLGLFGLSHDGLDPARSGGDPRPDVSPGELDPRSAGPGYAR